MAVWLINDRRRAVGVAAGVLLLLICMAGSLAFGIHTYTLEEIWSSYAKFAGTNEQLILRTSRVPRTLIAAAVGASLAVAGAVMQVLTRNPLASPSVFGVNSGASLLIVIGLTAFGSSMSMGNMVWIAFLGAAAASLCVLALGLGGGGRFEPIRLTLAGAAFAAFASSVTSGLILLNKQSLDAALLWMVGSVSGRKLDHLLIVLPYMATGWLLVMLLSGSLNVMALGDDNARSLGQRLGLIRLLSALAVVLLAGGSVAAAGPIAFVGLVVPHLCRALVGNDHRWLIPYCAITGAILLVAADTASRLILMPKEVPVGVATALIGVPFLIRVARRRHHE